MTPARGAVDGARRAVAAFERTFGRRPEALVRGPGRVNLIGEHTDYNDGFVLPLALDRAAWVALARRGDDRVDLVADDLGERRSFRVGAARLEERGDARADEGGWLEYPRAVAWTLRGGGHELAGFDGALASDVPRGAGLSSSAAVALAVAAAFRASSGFAWDPVDVALRLQRAENAWIGVASGIMDQLIGAAGEDGHALLIDCRTLSTRPVRMPAGGVAVVLDTMTRRGLVGSAYNERRRQCEEAARRLGVPALRDADLPALEAAADAMDAVTVRRARHVITENARTLRAAEAMAGGDAAGLGRLMDESHESLRGDFEVSSVALDAVVAAARAAPGCLGARMTGAGFGGCAVALVDPRQVELFTAAVTGTYRSPGGDPPAVYVCRPSAGAGEVALPDEPGTEP